MNKQMYDLVKDAIRNGASIEDVVAEVNLMADAANKELKPHAPLLEKYCKHALAYQIASDGDGRIDHDSLVTAMATYFVQHGFNPDPCFDNEKEFLEHVAGILDRGLDASKAAADLAQMEMEGASENEILNVLLRNTGSMLMEALNGFRN